MAVEPWFPTWRQDRYGKWWYWRTDAIRQQLYATSYHQHLAINTSMEVIKVGFWGNAAMASCNTNAKIAALAAVTSTNKYYSTACEVWESDGGEGTVRWLTERRKKIEHYKNQITSVIKSCDETNRQALYYLGKDVDNIKAVRDLAASTGVGLAAGAGYLGWAAVGIVAKNLSKVSDSFIAPATSDERAKAVGFGVVETAVDLMFLGIAPSAATMTIKEKLIVFGMLKGSLEGAKSAANGDNLPQIILNVAGETLAIGKDIVVEKITDWVVPVVGRLSKVVKDAGPDITKTVAGIVPGVAGEAGLSSAKAEANERLGQAPAPKSKPGVIALPPNLRIKGIDSDEAYIKHVCLSPHA